LFGLYPLTWKYEKYEKYGKVRSNSVTFSNTFGGASKGEELEWHLPGLHVQFTLDRAQAGDPGGLTGVLLIEVESASRLRTQKHQERDAKRTKL
jgi:hypothetical protein